MFHWGFPGVRQIMSTTTRLTIEQYDQMIADGAFEGPIHRQRVELIEGEIRRMSPIGPPHERAVDFLTRWSCKGFPEERGWVRIQSSIGLPGLESVPEPDVAWVRMGNYSRRRPTADDVLLIIEVADSSLRFDRVEKAQKYAASGITDYWVVDIPAQAVHVYRLPQAHGFGSCTTYRGADRLVPLHVPTAELVVEALFPPDERKEGTEVER
jgi:Uma2 family endonuclease